MTDRYRKPCTNTFYTECQLVQLLVSLLILGNDIIVQSTYPDWYLAIFLSIYPFSIRLIVIYIVDLSI